MKNLIIVVSILVTMCSTTVFSQENTVIIRAELQYWAIQNSNFTFTIYNGESDETVRRSYNRRNEPEGEMMAELSKEINSWLKNGYCLISHDTSIIHTGGRISSLTIAVLTKSKCSCNNQ